MLYHITNGVYQGPEELSEDLHVPSKGMRSLGNLKRIGGMLVAGGSDLEDLGCLETVIGHVYLSQTRVKTLGNLRVLCDGLYASRSLLGDLGNLEEVKGDIGMGGTYIKSLGRLTKCGGSIYGILPGEPPLILETLQEMLQRLRALPASDIPEYLHNERYSHPILREAITGRYQELLGNHQ